MGHIRSWTVVCAVMLGACGGDNAARSEPVEVQVQPAAERRAGAELAGLGYEQISREELERGRLDPGWRRVVQLDTTGLGAGAPNPERWEQISPERVNRGSIHLPLHGSASGPSVVAAQVLLDRALFSPGIIDGHWGKNAEKAVYWFQHREGLPTTGRVDRATLERLGEVAGRPGELVRRHRLTADDVEGPFVELPEDIYEKAKLDCLCYESLTEKLGERFHTSPEMLAQLNPGVDLDGLSAGDEIAVPNIRDPGAGSGAQVARLVVSDAGHFVHALDAQGRILFHFPSTLGASYSPSPTGDYRVTSITKEPWWHYQPRLLPHVDDEDEDATIPPGPNSAVGMVWMALSKPHYGIHGTSAPETIGYATSAGCVRLTNWDVLFLADRVRPGVEVEFRDT
jgi:lipoprotein-anchoring transpeptidase ErfK/SrfK